VADEEYGRQIPFGFLEKVKDDFIKNYGETGRNAVAMSLNRVYGYAPLWGRAAAAGGACAARAVGRPTAASREAPVSTLGSSTDSSPADLAVRCQAGAEELHGLRAGAPGGD
jgi:Regulated-SNARE-like domain